METIKKHAAKLKEQVAKQQQALRRHLGHVSDGSIVVDDSEFRCYQRLQKLNKSTKDAKNFQKDVVRGVESYISASLKEMEIARKLADECRKYATDNQTSPSSLTSAAIQFGDSRSLMEKQRESLLANLSKQVAEPLRASITGAPLEDARYMTHRYEKLRQEVEAQAADISRRRLKTKDSDINAENYSKLRGAESRLQELKSTLVALGREATEAMASVEDEQQQNTVQRLSTMVDAEKYYHQNVLIILGKLYNEMILENQGSESHLQQPLTEQQGSVVQSIDYSL